MSPTEIHQLNFGPITAHAFNKDRTQVAVCPNNNEVQIYTKAGKGWNLIHTLAEHDKLVTGIDWAPESNRLVTSSQDRNTYVWNFEPETNEWKPTLVLLRINRAATFVRWSPLENKFAVASGARVIAVCYFDEEHNWWTSKHLKNPIRSTVLSLDWHPNNVLLAAGSADFKARVFSAFIKGGVDQKPPPTAWGDKLPFNTICGEFSNGSGGWIHSVAFSPSGDALAFSGHDSAISIAYPGGAIQSVRLTSLPYLSLIWTSEKNIIAAGYDFTPVLFENTNEGW
ncbi:20472_t:CDS:2 [Funneliformis geosporum]|nr:20472_t:CDS:2 [Funneliformis geosporum]